MSHQSILLLGAGGHARACIDVLELHGGFRIGGLIGLPAEVGSSVLGYPVLGTDAELPRLRRDHTSALVTIGQIKTPEQRMRLHALAQSHAYTLPVIVSPRAHVSRHALLGAGTIVMHEAVVNAGAVVGRNCILNSLSLVEHDAVIEDHCHVATAAAINSGVHVSAGTFIGSNSCVRQGVRIGERSVIGMGQRVLKDCPAGMHLPDWDEHS
jgi:sugar O-acyltransferase (sialic acid O-acetyltransferase NeuD family)